MARVYNFGAGPAMLPQEVLSQVRDELLDWQRTGMSVMELPHRGEDFKNIAQQTEQDLRELLNIPNNYKVLFLQGGAQCQFAMIPMNLSQDLPGPAYVDTGIWSKKAIKEASRYADVHVAMSAEDTKYTTIPEVAGWDIPDEAAYFYFTDNETVNGVEFPYIPEVGDIPLVSDMSSNLLSRPFDITKYGLVFACAQKNVGPAGLTVVIVRDDLLKREPMQHTPSVFKYVEQVKEASMYNTPPTFAWYMAGLVLKWIKKQGGLDAMFELNQKKSQKLYEYIDSTEFYHNPVDAPYRSRLNVVFTLVNENLNQNFIKEATKGGLTNLKGHRLVGGMRASMYNSMPELGVDTLIAFMRDFEKRYG